MVKAGCVQKTHIPTLYEYLHFQPEDVEVSVFQENWERKIGFFSLTEEPFTTFKVYTDGDDRDHLVIYIEATPDEIPSWAMEIITMYRLLLEDWQMPDRKGDRLVVVDYVYRPLGGAIPDLLYR